jgi:catechol 2,3-dioxygenase-like lactoylglutathione lyase family enzyme
VFDHVTIRVAERTESERFYEAIAAHAGFRLARTTDDATVQAFHAAATGAGYRDNGAPGERPPYHPGYYSAFVLDPDGNNIEVVNHHR